MSYEIFYDRRCIKAGINEKDENLYVLLISSGSNNCWESSNTPEKVWWAVENNNGSILCTESELKEAVKKYDCSYIFKTRYTSFKYKEAECSNWLFSSIKNAFLVEEGVLWNKYHNKVNIYYKENTEDKYYNKSVDIYNTKALFETIQSLEQQHLQFSIGFECRDFFPRPKAKSIKMKTKRGCKFVIINKNKYFVSASNNNGVSLVLDANKALMFDTLEEAEAFKNSKKLSYEFFIKAIEKREHYYICKNNEGSYFYGTSRRKYISYRCSSKEIAKRFKTKGEANKIIELVNKKPNIQPNDILSIDMVDEPSYFII